MWIHTIRKPGIRSTVTDLTFFHLSPELPNELQNIIWEHAFYLGPLTTFNSVFIECRGLDRPPKFENLPFPTPAIARAAAWDRGDAVGQYRCPNAIGVEIPPGCSEPYYKQRLFLRVYPKDLLGLLQACSASPRVACRAFKEWFKRLLAEACKPVGEGGKPWILQRAWPEELLYRGVDINFKPVDNRFGTPEPENRKKNRW